MDSVDFLFFLSVRKLIWFSLVCSEHFHLPLTCFAFSGVDGLSIDITTMVDIRDQTNKELAMRLVTDIQSGEVFYTDLNGFQVSSIVSKGEITTCVQIYLNCCVCFLLDAASPTLPKAALASQLLSHAQPSVHPGWQLPPHAAHGSGSGCQQPGEWFVSRYILFNNVPFFFI